ncbi:MAG: hypothetical protein CVU57_30225 [Deltaproteobacteria bacterium HGW-Deltaproteobacteria-15]|jgi:tetratricopeptide (TPR) repeat protein|nr:MAG: hypothetical protein CVU57_30225 [Deltaproteobacteria bacterium HGW-Deltaproteobacteria-15]
MRASPLFKYNPGQSSPQEIEATFVAREQVLGGILKDLRSRGRSKSNQHYLIIGPRGIGKTNLLVMIKQQVLNDKALAKTYLPIQAAEEEYSIIGLRDFVTRILELISQEPDQNFRPDLQAIRTTTDDEEAAERAISVLKELSGKTKKKILLLVDSLDLILGNQFSDEAQIGRLRDLLMNESFLVLVGTAPTYFSEVSGYDRPLYNFFKTVHLEELSLEEMTNLLKKRAEWDQNKSFLDSLEQIKPKLRALHHLTGGNPRLALILYQLLTQSTLPEIRTDLQMLLDDLTPYYKARLESLPAQQRKVMDTFARLGRPATPTELAEETRFPVNQVNSILQRLREHGFVAPARQKRRRTTLYVVSERVFRVWHQMRFSPESRRRLEFLVEFIRIWYSTEEWEQETKRLLGEYRKHAGVKHYAEAAPYLEHLDYMIQGAPKAELRSSVEDAVVLSCITSGDCEKAKELLKKRIRHYEREGNMKRLSESWFILGYVYSELGNSDLQLSSYEKAVHSRPDFHQALYFWGTALVDLDPVKTGKQRESLLLAAIEKYDRALKIKPDKHEALSGWASALVELAQMKRDQERESLFSDAIDKCESALKIKPDQLEALIIWGNALAHLSEMKEGKEREALLLDAVRKYEKTLEFKQDSHEALYNWGNALLVLAEMKDDKEKEALLLGAIEKYNGALKSEPSNHEALNNCGLAFLNLAMMKELNESERLFYDAFEKFENALEFKPNAQVVLDNWGTAMRELAIRKEGKEQRELLDSALMKTAAASNIAKSDEMENLHFYSANHIKTALIAIVSALYSDDWGRAREYFVEILERFPDTDSKFAEKSLIVFFKNIAKEKTAGQLAIFLDMMEERSMTYELGLLMPFAKAVEYWQKGKDEEVLDRLNPEIREMVEKIIHGSPDGSSSE